MPRRGELPRERLVGELALARADPLLVLAPAGFGKTVTISQWAGSAERPVVWATVTGADSDPVVLISTLLAAVDAAGVRVTGPSSPLTGDEPAFSRRVLPPFLRSVEQVGLPVTMVVDDVHDMTGVRPAVVLTALLDALTAGSQLAIVGRARPDLPIAFWRRQGRVHEIGPNDLAFDQAEASRFIAGLDLPLGLPESVVAEIVSATQGWPVAVYLRPLAAARGEQAPKVTSAALAEYLNAVVLASADEGLVRFLARSSVLPSMSARSCDEVLDVRDSHRRLREVERSTLLVSRLEGAGGVVSAPSAPPRASGRRTRGRRSPGRQDSARAGGTFVRRERVRGRRRESCGQVEGSAAVRRHRLAARGRSGNRRPPVDSPQMAGERRRGRHRRNSDPVHHGGVRGGHGRGRRELEPLGPGDRQGGRSGLDRPLGPLERRGVPGAPDRPARRRRVRGVGVPGRGGAPCPRCIAKRGWRRRPRSRLRRVWVAHDLDEATTTTWAASVSAYLYACDGANEPALRELRHAESIMTRLDSILPWLQVLLDSFVARAHAELGDEAAAVAAALRAHHLLDRVPRSFFMSALVATADQALARSDVLSRLTPAALRLWPYLIRRETVKEIASELHLSPETVKTQLGSVYRKLGVSCARG